jgi:AcrR family transcriptional regulator
LEVEKMSQPRRKVAPSLALERSEIWIKKRGEPTTRIESRQRIRTAATRKALLEAALNVFIRDGFEASRIEDIAAEAGRSRGAFYVNFANKAEAFLALREQQVLKNEDRVRRRLQGKTTREEQLQAIEEHMAEFALDRSYLLLELEFKLFAIRHPRLLKRVAKKHLEAKREIEEVRDLFPKGGRGTLIVYQRRLTFEAIMEGFALNQAFSPDVMTREYIKSCMPWLAQFLAGLSR